MTDKKKKKVKQRWAQKVSLTSNALDLEKGVFTWQDSKKIARSLKQSAEQSLRRKGSSFQSAMSMLNFYINRSGKNLESQQKEILEQAKEELRIIFNRKQKNRKQKIGRDKI
ncbi:MAG: DUF3175 domain-containing protein [Candidatus Pacebacteria bacterium]|nr:DUF3175 domain-containing protein [Candidatus Paceibacterota bacterium]